MASSPETTDAPHPYGPWAAASVGVGVMTFTWLVVPGAITGSELGYFISGCFGTAVIATNWMRPRP